MYNMVPQFCDLAIDYQLRLWRKIKNPVTLRLYDCNSQEIAIIRDDQTKKSNIGLFTRIISPYSLAILLFVIHWLSVIHINIIVGET